jgi:hypothetical protein
VAPGIEETRLNFLLFGIAVLPAEMGICPFRILR